MGRWRGECEYFRSVFYSLLGRLWLTFLVFLICSDGWIERS